MTSWSTFWLDLVDQWPLILAGLYKTLLLAAIVSVTGLALGILVLYFHGSSRPVVRRIVSGYISFFVGTPLLVLLFLMYYGLPRVGLGMSPIAVALVGFTLNIAAYNSAYLSTARNALDPVELEAARAPGIFGSTCVFSHHAAASIAHVDTRINESSHTEFKRHIDSFSYPIHRVFCAHARVSID